uniref:Uncharacterized protein repA4 n=1 Tax=Serratia marcescens TaxID=615 RepID=A0A3G2LWV9_SERMA|nr:uncharacterized protein repA4 [Serratia marcescens]
MSQPMKFANLSPTKPLTTAEKRPRPGPKGRNSVAFNDGCCN